MRNRRNDFKNLLAAIYIPYYEALCKELGPHWQPYSGFRAISEQGALYAQGRSKPGKIVTNARGGESPHNYGCATDWCLWNDGKPSWDKKDPRWKEYEDACKKVGLKCGKDFGDWPHNELRIGVSWRDVFEVCHDQGLEAALKFIAENSQ